LPSHDFRSSDDSLMAPADGQMSDTESIELATRRLALALDALEAATERRCEADRGQAALANQVHILGGDRARLASELDEATARARTLESVNRDVAQRIDQAIVTVRGLLTVQDPSQDNAPAANDEPSADTA
jgi:hypothetical protein